jgi:DinB family protein
MLLDIGTLSTDLLSVNSQAVAVCDGLSDEQLGWRPHPGKWSIAENFIHLRITVEIFLPAIDHALAETISSGLILCWFSVK